MLERIRASSWSLLFWVGLPLCALAIFLVVTTNSSGMLAPAFCFHYGQVYMRPGETVDLPLFLRGVLSSKLLSSELSFVGEGVEQLELVSLSERRVPGPEGGSSVTVGVKYNGEIGTEIVIRGVSVRGTVSPIGQIVIEGAMWDDSMDAFFGSLSITSTNRNRFNDISSWLVPSQYTIRRLVLGNTDAVEGELTEITSEDSLTKGRLELLMRVKDEYWEQQIAVVVRPLIELGSPDGERITAPGPMVGVIYQRLR